MRKLDVKYWEQKFDLLEDVDVQAINDAFHSSQATTTGLTDEEKARLADMLVAGVVICKSDKQFDEYYAVAAKFNGNFAVNSLLASPTTMTIRSWRYDYRQIVKAIPDVYLAAAIKRVYNRLGFDVTDADIHIIGSQSSLYTMFLNYINEEADGNKVYNPGKDSNDIRAASFLNMYLLFDKIGFECIDFFTFMAELNVLYRIPPLIQKKKDTYGMQEEAIRRSRGRMNPSYYEIATVLCIDGE